VCEGHTAEGAAKCVDGRLHLLDGHAFGEPLLDPGHVAPAGIEGIGPTIVERVHRSVADVAEAERDEEARHGGLADRSSASTRFAARSSPVRSSASS
jgi:hypothetical protein